ncbi:hypothetical protein PO909_023459, partial [Leuciscus waleckii]
NQGQKREGFELSTHGVDPADVESVDWPRLNLRRGLLRGCCGGLMLKEGPFSIIEWFGLEKDAEGDCGYFALGGEDPFVWPGAREITPEDCGKDS